MIAALFDFILHIDSHINQLAIDYGPWLYLILFLIVFAETGLVVTPFLPGDSLLFAVGAVAAHPGSPLEVNLVAVLLITAGILGDFVNYSIGKRAGPKIFSQSSEKSWFFNKKHLVTTQKFYEKYGNATIIIARFAPIVRTFAPFVAGIARMNYSRFVVYNCVGAVLWVCSFLYAGFFFGNLDIVQRNFHYIIFAVIFLSILPMLVAAGKMLWQKHFSKTPEIKEF